MTMCDGSEISSPYLNMCFLDEQYGIRSDGNTLIIGSTALFVEKGDISIGGIRFKGTRRLWESLTRKNVNSDDHERRSKSVETHSVADLRSFGWIRTRLRHTDLSRVCVRGSNL